MKKSPYWTQMENSREVFFLFDGTVPQLFLYRIVLYYRLINRQTRQVCLNRLAVFAPTLKLKGIVLLGSHFGNIEAFR